MDLRPYRRWFALPDRRASPSEPGTPVAPGASVATPVSAPAVAGRGDVPGAAIPTIRVFGYGPDGLDEAALAGPDDVAAWKGKHPVTWVDVDGVSDADAIRRITSSFGMHVLAQEDVLNPTQRPKVERYDGSLFVVARMLTGTGDALESEQLSLFIGPGFVLTFQVGRPGDCLQPVRDRLRSGATRLRGGGADYLAWALLDAVVDGYFPVLEAFGERLDDLEDRILDRPDTSCIPRIHQVKRDLLALRRAVWPLRDALASLLREESDLVAPGTRDFLRDCLDHCVQVLDMIETYREIGASLMEAYQSSVGNRMNAIMKVLTIIATVFMPLSFLAGVYGMNFDTGASPYNLPELSWRLGYPFFWAVSLLSVAGMLWGFRRMGWLGGKDGDG